jgi:hypothetical protein
VARSYRAALREQVKGALEAGKIPDLILRSFCGATAGIVTLLATHWSLGWSLVAGRTWTVAGVGMLAGAIAGPFFYKSTLGDGKLTKHRRENVSSPRPILPPLLGESDVLTKCDYFVDVQLWPLHKTLDAHGWLTNFTDAEKEHAVHLLNGFLYFCPALIDQMFVAAVQALSSRLFSPGDSFLTFQSAWQHFIDTVVVTYVTGEVPNPSDSGLSFARKARQLLGIPEGRITTPDEAVRRLMLQPGPVLFVDDFVGSGSQFLRTWDRPVPIAGSTSSFEKVSSVAGASFYYCPLLCTQHGYSNITSRCPTVVLQPAHVITERYSALSPDSYIWPLDLQPTAVDFLRTASSKAGIPANGGKVNDWRGFHMLGLAIAMGDSVPDATLPLFYWEKNGWKPLIRRT